MAYEDTYRVSAHAVIVDSSNRVLVLRATYDGGYWGLPGGSIEPGETPDETLLRECREELGVGIEILYLSGVYYHRKHNSFAFLFRSTIPESEQIVMSPEHSAYDYKDPSTLSEVQRIRVSDCMQRSGHPYFRRFD